MLDYKINKKGFSLVEVLLAVVLLAIIIVPLCSTIFTAMKMNNRSRDVQAATDVAESVMEYIQSKTYEEIESDFATTGVDIKALKYKTDGKDVSSILPNGNNDFEKFTDAAMLQTYTLEGSGMNAQKVMFDSSDVLNSYMLSNIPYENERFDVAINFVEFKNLAPTETSDPEFFIYKVRMDVYLVNDKSDLYSGHNRNNFIGSIEGSVINKK